MKLVLLTGFLGAGKTTFLNHLFKEFKDQKIGVLMNEFGEKSVDSALIHGENFDLLELTGGSVFCACLRENFIRGLAELRDYDLEYVFVESSGVADPSNMGVILEMVRNLSGKSYDYRGSLCIVDALYFEETFEVVPALKKQLICASAVIINKTDLQTGEKIKAVRDRIKAVNPGAELLEAAFCDVPIKPLLERRRAFPAPGETVNTWESRPKTIMLTTEAQVDDIALENFLNRVVPSAYRVKGFAKTSRGPVEVSGVNDRVEFHLWNKPVEKTEIVVISSVGIKIISLALAAWKEYLGGAPLDLK